MENNIDPEIVSDWHYRSIFVDTSGPKETSFTVDPALMEGYGQDLPQFEDEEVQKVCKHFGYNMLQINNNELAAPMLDPAPMYIDNVQPVWIEDGYQSRIVDENSFIMARESYKSREQEHTDFPEHLEGQHYYIRRLFRAMKNTENVMDTENFTASFLRMCPDFAVEMACWDLFLAARDIQRWGRLTAAHHKYKIKKFDSFHERIMAIIKCCRDSKAFCKGMMEPSRIFRYAQDPYGEIDAKKMNSKLNSRKSGINKLGQVVIREENREFDELTRQWVGPKTDLQEAQTDNFESVVDLTQETHTFKRKRYSDVDEEPRDVKEFKRSRVSSMPTQKPKARVKTLIASLKASNLDAPLLDDSLLNLYNEYRMRLCTLLGVPFDANTCLQLDELRFYAYCENQDATGPGNRNWRHNYLPDGWYGTGKSIENKLGDCEYNHFALCPHFARLSSFAISRGDLHADKTWHIDIPERNFNTKTALFDQMVCGLVENRFGILKLDHTESFCDFIWTS